MKAGTDYFHDGTVGLSLERHSSTLRLLPKPRQEGDHTPDYLAVMHAARWTDQVVGLSAALGSVSKRHQALIVKTLQDLGYRWVFSSRAEQGRIPMAEICQYPPFQGLHVLDLNEAAALAHRLYPPAHVPEKK